MKRFLLGMLSLAVAAAIWLPVMHMLFEPDLDDYRPAGSIGPRARAMAEHRLAVWLDPERRESALADMRAANAEWDFMGRTFLVLALSNIALREPDRAGDCLDAIDSIIDQTLALEAEHGQFHFLMPYAKGRPFVADPARSVFVDGEIALMLGARRLVRDNARYRRLHVQRVERLIDQMSAGRVMCGESYPDECWTFCNSVAVAAVRMHEVLDGADHEAFISDWLDAIRTHLVHEDTGMLVAAFTVDGQTLHGPEGTTIWLVAHCLKLVDPEFAQRQYELARRELGRDVLGFGYSREWAPGHRGHLDIDSGPVLPGLEASASASGLAVLGAASFADDAYLRRLLTSLHFVGMPIERDGELHFAASNPVGDAVLLYAMTQGPLWDKVMEADHE